MRIRLKYSRQGPSRYLSHLDMVRVFLRALRREEVPLAYSQGFNPQPRLAFAAPQPVGTAGLAEYLDLFLTEPMEIAKLLRRLNRQLPPGIEALDARGVPERGDSLMALVNTFEYRIELPGTRREKAAAALKKLKEAPRVLIWRKGKKGPAERDIKPHIKRICLVDQTDGLENIRGKGWVDGHDGAQESSLGNGLVDGQENGLNKGRVDGHGAGKGEGRGQGWHLSLTLTAGPRGSVRPEEILSALDLEDEGTLIIREGVFIAEGEKKFTPFDL